MRSRLLTLGIFAGAVWFALAPTRSGQASEAKVPELCRVPAYMTADMVEFPNAARRLAEEGQLTIVAIGASSTEGTGASSKTKSWPARLGALLGERLAGVRVNVVNLGQRRQTARMVLDRLHHEVAQINPALVIWETGTVEAVRATDPAEFAQILTEGAALESEHGADLILMDPQYARDTARLINFQPYVDAVRQMAGLPDVNLFPRHEIMRYWSEEDRLTPRTRDEMTKGNDDIYDCVAQILADVIDRGLRHVAHAQRR
jgi:lysophospholipase L1-like esterase